MPHFLSELSERDLTTPLTAPLAHQLIQRLKGQIRTCSPYADETSPGIVGQEHLIDALLIGLILGDGHSLLEGNPGLAKTLCSQTTGKMAGLTYSRIQFMPDTMPSDLILKELLTYDGDQPRIVAKLGPMFCNILLADEINRASPKAQAALLEACEEGFITPMNRPRRVIRPVEPFDEAALLAEAPPLFGLERFAPQTRQGQLFLVLATQNPIEQEGVYPLSKAQEDRFLFKLVIDYPLGDRFAEISRHAFEGHVPRDLDHTEENHVRTLYFFSALRQLLLGPSAAERWFDESNRRLREKVETLINFSHVRPFGGEGDGRDATAFDGSSQKGEELKWVWSNWASHADPKLRDRAARLQEMLARTDPPFPEVLSGSSPRGLLKIIRAAHARAFLYGKIDDDVRPAWEDFSAVAHDVLRHRVRLTPGFEAMGARSDTVVDLLLEWIDQWK